MAGKRVRSDTNFQPKKKKCAKRSFVADDDDDDRISQLPDDIIVDILSFLSLKEAARTSVLSSRWINLWKHTRSLDFDAQSVSSLKSERHKYVQWVNSILQSHKSPTLKDFRIRFCFDGPDSNSVVTQWLKFAFSRQVQRLELDFPNCNSWNGGYYRFPEDQFLASSSSMQLFEFKSLKALSFKNVNVSGGAIEFFLRNCPLLEQLIVHSPGKSISKLEICGSSLVLKHLEIVQFPGLESLRISAPTLTSLRFTSLKGVSLEDVPMLVDVSVSLEGDSISVESLLSVFFCCISRLETLNLSLLRCQVRREIDELSNSSDMPKKLKKLVIEYDSCGDESLIRLASLTRASPYLEEFVLKNKWFKSWMKRRRVDDDDDDDGGGGGGGGAGGGGGGGAGGGGGGDDVIRFQQHHLKESKSCGYQGRPSVRSLVHYMLKNSVVLENAKRNLQPQLPHHVKLVIP